MEHNLPGAFYALVIAFTLFTGIVGAPIVEYYFDTWQPDKSDVTRRLSARPITQRRRYLAAVSGGFFAIAQVAYLAGNYSPVNVQLWLTSWGSVSFAIMYWFVILANSGIVVASIAYAIHAHRHPAISAKLDRLSGQYVPTAVLRMQREIEREEPFGYWGK